ncbi:hypothetical protein F4780DRAFT_721866 [Xylariomycetidae sp. FL0641]|nr:hypothetical protein F4780DRAFT_721866 [Xylariomycetidae sp. FL0641]
MAMDIARHHRSTYQNYPFLTNSEWTETCHYLEQRYCQAILGPLRRAWRLHLLTALGTSHQDSPVTYIQITRSLEDKAVDEDLVSQIEGIGFQEPRRSRRLRDRPQQDTDQDMIDQEEADKNSVVQRQTPRTVSKAPYVTYEVHFHPTYRAPCLWFSLHNLTIEESPLDIETVFRRLVPDQFQQPLRGQGSIGGISIDHHPITGLPSFFVHPCLVGDAMNGFDCPKEDYLMVWLGIVGGCVGLWVPKEMALTQQS